MVASQRVKGLGDHYCFSNILRHDLAILGGHMMHFILLPEVASSLNL